MKDLIPWGPPPDYQAPWNAQSLGDFLLERSLTLEQNLRQQTKRRAWDGKEYTCREFKDYYGSDEHWHVIGHNWRTAWLIGLLGCTPYGPPKAPHTNVQVTSGPVFEGWKVDVECINGRKWPKAYTLADGQRFDPQQAEVTCIPTSSPKHRNINHGDRQQEAPTDLRARFIQHVQQTA